MKKFLAALLTAAALISSPACIASADYYEPREAILAYDVYAFLVSVINPQTPPQEAIGYAERIGLLTIDYTARYRRETGKMFDLHEPMTRQEFAIATKKTLDILKKFGVEYVLTDKPKGGRISKFFKDGKEIRKHALDDVEFAVNAGILKLYALENGYFTMPEKPITLEEISDFINAVNLSGNLRLSSYTLSQFQKFSAQ